jgi:hypothetical protein
MQLLNKKNYSAPTRSLTPGSDANFKAYIVRNSDTFSCGYGSSNLNYAAPGSSGSAALLTTDPIILWQLTLRQHYVSNCDFKKMSFLF